MAAFCPRCHTSGIPDLSTHACPFDKIGDISTRTFYQVTEYQVSALPPGHPAWGHYYLSVRYVGDGYWQVGSGRSGLLAHDGTWQFRRAKTLTRDGWRSAYLFDLPTAMSLASTAAHRMSYRDHPVQSILEEDDDE